MPNGGRFEIDCMDTWEKHKFKEMRVIFDNCTVESMTMHDIIK